MKPAIFKAVLYSYGRISRASLMLKPFMMPKPIELLGSLCLYARPVNCNEPQGRSV